MQSPKPLALSDDQLSAVLAAATPLPPDVRGAFLETCAREIAALPMIGDGSLHRLVMVVQKRYFRPPLETEEHGRRGVSKHARELV
jgi:hypothetical protein